MEPVAWYSEHEIHRLLEQRNPDLLSHAGWISQQLNNAFNKGHERGFAEGEEKQAKLELQGRDRFLEDLKKQIDAGKFPRNT
jgi:flagellar biosynthesis/type III secretory pathway protein FliH